MPARSRPLHPRRPARAAAQLLLALALMAGGPAPAMTLQALLQLPLERLLQLEIGARRVAGAPAALAAEGAGDAG
ncbi:MAG: hypothetical protein HYZ20_14190 [Burkholderiales bacterium]|nr:hypothetical protein [Burkholderiales bacterium]